MKRCKKVAGVVLAAGIAATTVALGSGTVNAATQGYVTVKTKTGNMVQYIGKDGKPYTGLHYMSKDEGEKNPHYEFFDKNGYRILNWRYLTKADGLKTSQWSYFGTNGWMRTGWQAMGTKSNPDGKNKEHWSYFGNDGALRNGWQTMGTKTNPDGNNKVHWSYFGNNGWLRSGWQVMSTKTNPDGNNKSHWSYFGNNGWLRTGWQYLTAADGEKTPHWSYFGSNGWLRTGWQYLTAADGEKTPHWSYFGNDGWLRTGWQKIRSSSNPDGSNKEHWSYFGSNGWLVTGTQKIDGKTYVFDSKGWLTSGAPGTGSTTSQQGSVKDGCYTISPLSNSKTVIDIDSASTADGAKVQTFVNNNTFAQKFQIKHLGSEVYSVRTAVTIYGSGLTANGKIAAGTAIVQKKYTGADTQKWKIVSAGKDAYTFKTVDGKYVLDVSSGVAKLAKSTNSDSQKFKLTKTSGYMIRNNRKYYFNSNGQTPMIGIDVSKWNDDINWKAVKADGIGFAIIRTSYGSNSKWEWKTVENIKGCEANGIPYGVYFYSIATTNEEADKEVALVKKILGNYKPKLGVYIDIEDTAVYEKAFGNIYKDPARRKITNLTKRMANSLKASGYKVGVYANANYFNNVLYKNELPDVLWGAYYYTNPNSNPDGLKSPNTDWNLWQYSETGTVKGINGKVDMNTLIKKYW